MKTPEEIIIEVLNLEGEIEEKHYSLTIKVDKVIECIRLAQSQVKNNADLSDVSQQRELLIAFLKKLKSGNYNYIQEDSLKVDTFLSNL